MRVSSLRLANARSIASRPGTDPRALPPSPLIRPAPAASTPPTPWSPSTSASRSVPMPGPCATSARCVGPRIDEKHTRRDGGRLAEAFAWSRGAPRAVAGASLRRRIRSALKLRLRFLVTETPHGSGHFQRKRELGFGACFSLRKTRHATRSFPRRDPFARLTEPRVFLPPLQPPTRERTRLRPCWWCATRTARSCAAGATRPSTAPTSSWRSTGAFCLPASASRWRAPGRNPRTARNSKRRRTTWPPRTLWRIPMRVPTPRPSRPRGSGRRRRCNRTRTSRRMRWCRCSRGRRARAGAARRRRAARRRVQLVRGGLRQGGRRRGRGLPGHLLRRHPGGIQG